MEFRRGSLNAGTVVGVLVVIVAVAGQVFLDWTWNNPEGKVLPLAIGVAAALAGALVVARRLRS